MSQSILLRKLTLKSKLKFGRYRNYTVEKLIKLKGKKAINYLRYCYYNFSNISFVEDFLLETLEIDEEDLIDKPGKSTSKEVAEKYYPIENRLTSMTLNNNPILQKGVNHRIGRTLNNKQNLQRKNHGL